RLIVILPVSFSSVSVLSTAPPPPALSTLSLHDALPIWRLAQPLAVDAQVAAAGLLRLLEAPPQHVAHVLVILGERSRGGQQIQRSEEHTSELQSLAYLVCRLLLEKKKTTTTQNLHSPAR